MVLLINRQRKVAVDSKIIKETVQKMLYELEYKDFEISIFLTTNSRIQRYNKEFRNKDYATDILSFPYHANTKPGKRILAESEEDKNLGDIIVSVEFLAKNVASSDEAFNVELIKILAHGVAHLLNYSHETDEKFKQMQAVEKRLLEAVSS
jgi:probable rRNA maturation factor